MIVRRDSSDQNRTVQYRASVLDVGNFVFAQVITSFTSISTELTHDDSVKVAAASLD